MGKSATTGKPVSTHKQLNTVANAVTKAHSLNAKKRQTKDLQMSPIQKETSVIVHKGGRKFEADATAESMELISSGAEFDVVRKEKTGSSKSRGSFFGFKASPKHEVVAKPDTIKESRRIQKMDGACQTDISSEEVKHIISELESLRAALKINNFLFKKKMERKRESFNRKEGEHSNEEARLKEALRKCQADLEKTQKEIKEMKDQRKENLKFKTEDRLLSLSKIRDNFHIKNQWPCLLIQNPVRSFGMSLESAQRDQESFDTSMIMVARPGDEPLLIGDADHCNVPITLDSPLPVSEGCVWCRLQVKDGSLLEIIREAKLNAETSSKANELGNRPAAGGKVNSSATGVVIKEEIAKAIFINGHLLKHEEKVQLQHLDVLSFGSSSTTLTIILTEKPEGASKITFGNATNHEINAGNNSRGTTANIKRMRTTNVGFKTRGTTYGTSVFRGTQYGMRGTQFGGALTAESPSTIRASQAQVQLTLAGENNADGEDTDEVLVDNSPCPSPVPAPAAGPSTSALSAGLKRIVSPAAGESKNSGVTSISINREIFKYSKIEEDQVDEAEPESPRVGNMKSVRSTVRVRSTVTAPRAGALKYAKTGTTSLGTSPPRGTIVPANVSANRSSMAPTNATSEQPQHVENVWGRNQVTTASEEWGFLISLFDTIWQELILSAPEEKQTMLYLSATLFRRDILDFCNQLGAKCAEKILRAVEELQRELAEANRIVELLKPRVRMDSDNNDDGNKVLRLQIRLIWNEYDMVAHVSQLKTVDDVGAWMEKILGVRMHAEPEETLAIWTLEEFRSRLKWMRDVRSEFEIQPHADPGKVLLQRPADNPFQPITRKIMQDICSRSGANTKFNSNHAKVPNDGAQIQNIQNQLTRVEKDAQRLRDELRQHKKDRFFEEELMNRMREELEDTPLLVARSVLHHLDVETSMLKDFEDTYRIMRALPEFAETGVEDGPEVSALAEVLHGLQESMLAKQFELQKIVNHQKAEIVQVVAKNYPLKPGNEEAMGMKQIENHKADQAALLQRTKELEADKAALETRLAEQQSSIQRAAKKHGEPEEVSSYGVFPKKESWNPRHVAAAIGVWRSQVERPLRNELADLKASPEGKLALIEDDKCHSDAIQHPQANDELT